MQEELKELKNQIEPYFEGEKTVETLLTPVGAAERKVTNIWDLDDKRVGDLRNLLGDRFGEYVKEEIKYKLTTKLRKAAMENDDFGKEIRDYIKIHQRVTISFKGINV
ncbi:MAG: hypothetical protein H0Z28_11105 [Archaeoglobus sp.]|nr:hypothetical protein [Archaeoglobus sp.]